MTILRCETCGKLVTQLKTSARETQVCTCGGLLLADPADQHPRRRAWHRWCAEVIRHIGPSALRCSEPAVCLIDNGDEHLYPMCEAHASHNERNRGAYRFELREPPGYAAEPKEER